MSRLVLLVPVLILILFPGAALPAGQVVIADFSSGADPKGVPMGWQLKEKSGKADVAVVPDGGLQALRLKSTDASFSLQKQVDVDLRQHPVLSWKWKVTELPRGGDYRKSGTDDQAAQLFVAFSKFQAIVYIWDTTAPAGTAGDAVGVWPMNIKVVVVRSGPGQAGTWLSESRNVYEDYKRFFGQEPPPVQGFRLQINSQHTGTSAESYFAGVAFGGKD